jgi:hypothetical protein
VPYVPCNKKKIKINKNKIKKCDHRCAPRQTFNMRAPLLLLLLAGLALVAGIFYVPVRVFETAFEETCF